MFRDLVSPSRTAAAELEAVTAERDFFKEKYAAHASEMEAMKTQLKESQRMVDKLRNQVLDLSQQVMELEGEKSRGGGVVRQKQVDRPSLAEINNSEHSTDKETDSQQPRRNSSNVLTEVSTPLVNKKQAAKEDENSEKENNDENEEVDSEEEGGESEGESDDDDDSHDNDEAEAIRLKASRMLAWASYQSTRRTPTKTIDDNDDGEDVMETPTQPTTRPSAAYTLPTKIQSLLDDDEDTDASSLVEQQQVASDSKLTAKGGKIGKFVNNLKDMIGTQSESDSSYENDDESHSSSDSECSNLSENLARMQLDVRFADGQDEH
eukprot:scaffold4708_cov116-Skeletonema_marinoi.AAC.6